MDEIIIGYGSLMSADGLRHRHKARDLSHAFKGHFIVNFPRGKRGLWKYSKTRDCFTMDISGFTLYCEEVPPGTLRPEGGFQCVALVIDAQDSRKFDKLQRIRKREGYPERAWNKVVSKAMDGSESVAEYLWNRYGFGSSGECQWGEWEKVHSKLEEYRENLAQLDNGTSLCGRYTPVPIRIGKDGFGIVSYADTLAISMADALNKSNDKSEFAQYVGQCLLARYHEVDVSDICNQLEKVRDPDLAQRVERYIRPRASQEAQFPRLLGNEGHPQLDK